ncbi:MAG: hypothetical protein ACRC0V_01075 [Fusobacteriaceae bacterium]
MEFEIYVDNEKLVTRRRFFKTVGLAIQEASNKLKKNGKIITSIDMNGEVLDENFKYSSGKQILEIQTKTERIVTLEGIGGCKKYLERYSEIVEGLEDESLEEFMDEETALEELLHISGWFHNLIGATIDGFILEDSESKFFSYFEDLEEVVESAKEAFEMGDVEIVLEILKYDIGKLINEFVDEYENYLEELYLAGKKIALFS